MTQHTDNAATDTPIHKNNQTSPSRFWRVTEEIATHSKSRSVALTKPVIEEIDGQTGNVQGKYYFPDVSLTTAKIIAAALNHAHQLGLSQKG